MTLLKVNRPRLSRNFDDLFRNFFDENMQTSPTVWRPAMDALENEKSYVVSFSLPGFERDDINVTMKNGTLTVKAEHKSEDKQEGDNFIYREISRGTFQRSIELPENIKGDKIDAEYKSGILNLTIPKTEAALPKEIEVKVK